MIHSQPLGVPCLPSRPPRSIRTLLPGLVVAAGLLVPAPVPAAEDPACSDPRSRQFDFWIGDWEVINSDGSVAGRDLVAPILDDCVLQETWTGISGSAGTSLNFFDSTRGKWRQFWVWRDGSTLELEGGLVDGTMVMAGRSLEEGRTIHNRISWIPQTDRTVRQRWEISRDDGQTWNTIFDGTYRPADSR
jgi:hypothetical protein